MGYIQQLDSQTISKIKAGEVIERPASIVKELLENSLDAGATQISIAIEDGGKRLIQVTDNGSGILPEDLPLAPIQHATSKIRRLEDIYDVSCFGFRGEALASMCHVAELELISATQDGEAYRVTAVEGTISEPTRAAHPKGTTVTVRNLFEAIPVRQGFLKSAATEFSYIYDTVLHLSLIHPEVDFKLTHNHQEALNTSGIRSLKSRAILAFGKSIADHLLDIDTEIGELHFSGLISAPTLTFPNRSKQVLSVNKRLIKNAILQKALLQGYRDLIPNGRFPLAILNITLPQRVLDVNIHPQKTDIKFLNPGFLFDSVPKVVASQVRALNLLGHSETFARFSPVETPSTSGFSLGFSSGVSGNTWTPPLASTAPLFSPQLFSQPAEPVPFWQLFNTYLAFKTPDGLCLFDQHAVHERILYEVFKQRHAENKGRQPLLIGDIVEVSPDLYQLFLENQALLNWLDFVVDDFGNNCLRIREIPAALVDIDTTALIIDLLENIKKMPDLTPDLSLVQKEKLEMMACKAAIKAGKKMKDHEVQQLIRDFLASPANYTCPHGRPLFVQLKQHDLEKLFLRT
ncbi:MAG: DNA mismatch repair endonuclease MutL [Candidatus Margulisiibacteriota bacterium]